MGHSREYDLFAREGACCFGSGIRLPERDWTLYYSRIDPGERPQAGVGILSSPQLSGSVLEFSAVNKRVASIGLEVAGGKVFSVVVAYEPNCSKDYLAFLGSLVVSWKGSHLGIPRFY